ncbi:hypothetical protein BDR06DRAFT_1003940 [Suillus hirtellus]|nr:hypothetical protein BDR06DRAFT_1003940 [Suillus hirtellus]
MSSQFELQAQLFAKKLKDADNVSCYISVFKNMRRWFAEMAIVFTDGEAVFLLLQGLLQTLEWMIFKHMTMASYSSSCILAATSTSTTAATPAVTFMTVTSHLSEEANRICGEHKLLGPGSEYANTMLDLKANPKTRIHMHKSNPKGVACDNPACAGLPWLLTHDCEHCFQQGRGMEGKGGNACPKTRFKEITAAATPNALTSPANTNLPSSSTQSTLDLACTIIEEVHDDSLPDADDMACIISQSMSMILDSGMTSTLITAHEFFWTYSDDSHVTVKTANHRRLPTLGYRDCIADLTIRGKTHCLHLANCLHAPGAMINLLSVGYMVEKGWAVSFLPAPARCQLTF